jgi:hypothetical protein
MLEFRSTFGQHNWTVLVSRKFLSECQLRVAVATRGVSSHFRNAYVLAKELYGSDGIARPSFFD